MGIESFEFRYPTEEEFKRMEEQKRKEIEATKKALEETEYEKIAETTPKIKKTEEGEFILGEITAGELSSKEREVEAALEKLTDDKSFITETIEEVIQENEKDPAIQEFLEFERKQPELPTEVKRVKPVRESLIDSSLITLEKLKPLYKDSESLKQAMKKAIISKIRSRAESGMFRMRFS